MIEVLPSDPQWILEFARIRNRVWPVVHRVAQSIEHVGSTSVPGLAAKPVIDIAIVVPSAVQSAEAIRLLEGLGYQHRGDLGIKGREAFLRPQPSFKHNLYVVLADSLSLKNHLRFKKYLLENPEVRQQYSDLKISLAKKYAQDIDRYCEAKTPFILNILKQMDFSGAELHEIAESNRLK